MIKKCGSHDRTRLDAEREQLDSCSPSLLIYRLWGHALDVSVVHDTQCHTMPPMPYRLNSGEAPLTATRPNESFRRKYPHHTARFYHVLNDYHFPSVHASLVSFHPQHGATLLHDNHVLTSYEFAATSTRPIDDLSLHVLRCSSESRILEGCHRPRMPCHVVVHDLSGHRLVDSRHGMLVEIHPSGGAPEIRRRFRVRDFDQTRIDRQSGDDCFPR